jgi:hypothetical protein
MKRFGLQSFIALAALFGICMATEGFDTVGTIIPTEENPILAKSTNLDQVVSYTFKFLTTHSVPVGGQVKITFPEQYISGLGLSSPVCTMGTCSVFGRTVTIVLTTAISNNNQVSIVIDAVKNPASQGGTGPFILQTYRSTYLVD